MNGTEKLKIESTHTEAMIANELQRMLGVGKVRLTLGALASLALLKSPYLYGGEVSNDALESAYSVVKHDKDMSPLEFHKALQDDLDTGLRAFALIVPEAEQQQKGKTSEIETFSPEWFADVASQACLSMPSLTCHQVFWEAPLALISHLAVSTMRRNGAITERPRDINAALKAFRELKNG